MSEGRKNSDQYLLRFPDGMRERLRIAAEANNRSMNAEIISRLEQTLDHGEDDITSLLQKALRLATAPPKSPD